MGDILRRSKRQCWSGLDTNSMRLRGLLFVFHNRVRAATSDWTNTDCPPLLLTELQSINSGMQRRNVETSELEMEVSG